MGNTFPPYEPVRLWINELKRGRTSIEDALRLRIPKTAVISENIEKFHDIVLVVRRVKMRELAEAIGTSIDLLHFILHHKLHMKKRYAQ